MPSTLPAGGDEHRGPVALRQVEQPAGGDGQDDGGGAPREVERPAIRPYSARRQYTATAAAVTPEITP